jgi:hypothetical protein
MNAPKNVKPNGSPVRVGRGSAGARELECGWSLIRVEPESGNVICGRGRGRVNCPRREFELLNFPGSDDMWNIIADHKDDDLRKAKEAWTELDLLGVVSALIHYVRKLDPAFSGVQTIADLTEKIREIESVCKRSMDLLRLEIKRTQKEYDRFAARTELGRDKKDDLLARVSDLENEYAARAYRYETQLPAWRRLASAIQSTDKMSQKN